jgi:hypothetical protein
MASMARRFATIVWIGIFVFGLCMSTGIPAGTPHTESRGQAGNAGMDGHVDFQFISAQKHPLSASVDNVLPNKLDYRAKFESHVEHLTDAAPRVVSLAQNLPLRI